MKPYIQTLIGVSAISAMAVTATAQNSHTNRAPSARTHNGVEGTQAAHPNAIAVAVGGSFNDWHPTTRSMHTAGGGYWRKDTGLPLGMDDYCLVADGQWLPDPCVRESVGNPFGGRNSVLNAAG